MCMCMCMCMCMSMHVCVHVHVHVHVHVPKSHLVSEFDRFISLFMYVKGCLVIGDFEAHRPAPEGGCRERM